MKRNININTLAGNTINLTVEAYNGMIHITTITNGSEFYLIRLPQELTQWPIGTTLRMNADSGNDIGGQLVAELDGESAERLNAILDEAARRVNEEREYEYSEIEAPEYSEGKGDWDDLFED